ncbi:MAG TPA: biotin/lipoyl-containing protein [Steroidobacteraceae bacterium]|nr:biotin/lipoyl-containing protein [Steroidobacteraceae bacterium]
MPYRLQIDGQESDVQVTALRPQLRVRSGTLECTVGQTPAGADGGGFALSLDEVRYRGWRYRVGECVYVRFEGRTYCVQLRCARRSDAASAQEEVRASMPGVVVAVHCQSGQQVQAGERLLTLESMKLQMTIVAAHAAQVRQLHVAADAVFERGALLVSLSAAKE